MKNGQDENETPDVSHKIHIQMILFLKAICQMYLFLGQRN
jgi:hypothetical protein